MNEERPDAPKTAVRLTALSVVDAATILSRAGSKLVTAELVRKDIDAGAPTNPDGTLNLVHYAAWLSKERAHGD